MRAFCKISQDTKCFQFIACLLTWSQTVAPIRHKNLMKRHILFSLLTHTQPTVTLLLLNGWLVVPGLEMYVFEILSLVQILKRVKICDDCDKQYFSAIFLKMKTSAKISVTRNIRFLNKDGISPTDFSVLSDPIMAQPSTQRQEGVHHNKIKTQSVSHICNYIILLFKSLDYENHRTLGKQNQQTFALCGFHLFGKCSHDAS